MMDNVRFLRFASQPPLVQLIVSLFIIIVTGTTLFYLILLPGTLIFDCTFSDMLILPDSDAGPHQISILKYLQVSQEIAFFLIPSLVISRILGSQGKSFLQTDKFPRLIILLSAILLSLLIIPVTTYTGFLNSKMQLPDIFSGTEKWIRSKEEEASRLTTLMVASSGFLTLLANIIIVAAIPAIAEEFIFRGVFQQLFIRVLRSAHAGIWITAVFFSAVHFQFYGFLPRLILGLTFGYLFYWTKSLWTAITAHFINNGMLVIIAFYTEMGKAGEDAINNGLQKPDFPFLPVILCSLILFLLWHNYRKSRFSSDYF